MAQITITLTVPDAELARVRNTILRAMPIPDANEDDQPDMTFNQWVQTATRNFWRSTYRRGLMLLREDGADPDDSGTILT